MKTVFSYSPFELSRKHKMQLLLMKTEVVVPSLCNPLESGLIGQSGIGLGTITKLLLSQLDGRVGLGSEGVDLTGKGCFLPTWIAEFNKIGQMVESGPTMQMYDSVVSGNLVFG